MSRVRQASAGSPSPTQSCGAVRSRHSKGELIAGHMQNIPEDATPDPIGAERKDKSGSPHMERGADINSTSLKLTQPGAAAMADSRVTTGIQEQCTRVPKLMHSLWFPVTRKPFHLISVKYRLHTFHVLWDFEGDGTLGSMPSHCMPWLYRIWSYRNIKYLFQMPCIHT